MIVNNLVCLFISYFNKYDYLTIYYSIIVLLNSLYLTIGKLFNVKINILIEVTIIIYSVLSFGLEFKTVTRKGSEIYSIIIFANILNQYFMRTYKFKEMENTEYEQII